jgi:hypothetical protein
MIWLGFLPCSWKTLTNHPFFGAHSTIASHFSAGDMPLESIPVLPSRRQEKQHANKISGVMSPMGDGGLIVYFGKVLIGNNELAQVGFDQ